MVRSMTRRFLAAMKKVTTKPVTRLVNRHHHMDHVGGNFLLREAEIISHTYCRAEIVRTGLPVEFLQQRIPRFAAEFPKLKLAVPEVTFEDRLVFHQAGRAVELRHLGPAHTFGDAFVYLPKDKLLFAGDLAFYYVTPLAFQGHVGNWIKVADRILKLEVETIVPGHGPIGGKKELRGMARYCAPVRPGAQQRLARIATIIFASFSGRAATLSAAQTAAPLLMPAGMPSCRATRRAVTSASSSRTWMISSMILVFRTRGTNPAPMPWIWCGPGAQPDRTAERSGSTAMARKLGFRGLIPSDTPVIVPPVPTPLMRMSTAPSVSSQISRAVVRR